MPYYAYATNSASSAGKTPPKNLPQGHCTDCGDANINWDDFTKCCASRAAGCHAGCSGDKTFGPSQGTKNVPGKADQVTPGYIAGGIVDNLTPDAMKSGNKSAVCAKKCSSWFDIGCQSAKLQASCGGGGCWFGIPPIGKSGFACWILPLGILAAVIMIIFGIKR